MNKKYYYLRFFKAATTMFIGLALLLPMAFVPGGSAFSVGQVLTSVQLSPASATITIGGTQNFSATPLDQAGALYNPMATTIVWSSDNTAVATVNSANGLVTGVSVGTALITATANDGAVTAAASATITVTAAAPTPVVGITISPANTTINIGGTQNLSAIPMANFSATDYMNHSPVFTTSDAAVATVNSTTGLVTGVSAGSVTITATSIVGTTAYTGTASITVTAAAPISVVGITISPAASTITVGNTLNILATPMANFSMTDYMNNSPVFTTSDAAVATVNSTTGLVTGVSAGSVTITATSIVGSTSYYGTAVITVDPATAPISVTGITISPAVSTITTGGTQTFSAVPMANFSMTDYMNHSPVWSSSNSAVASVNPVNGVVTGVSAGSATITATSIVGTTAYTGTATITVTGAAPTPVIGINVSPASAIILIGGTYDLSATPMANFNGADYMNHAPVWTSSNPLVATINSANGLVTGVSAGSATITATSIVGTTAYTGTATITVAAPVTGITISPAVSTITTGGTQTFSAVPMANFSMTDYMNHSPVWSSSNSAVASVNPVNGVVTGVSAGSATITATSIVGTTAYTGTATITVTGAAPTPVIGINVSPAIATLAVGGTQNLSVTPMANFSAADFMNNPPVFTTSDSAVATVNSVSGIITGVSAGTATITATSIVGTTAYTGTSVITVTAGPPAIVNGIDVAPMSQNMFVGSSVNLSASFNAVSGINLMNAPAISWISSDSAIASVGTPTLISGISNVAVAAVSAGTATITASAMDLNGAINYIGTATINVSNPTAAPILTNVSIPDPNAGTMSPKTITAGANTQFNALVFDQFNVPFAGANLTWSSSNPAAATVGATTGLVTGIYPGTTTLSVTASDGAVSVSANFALSIIAPPSNNIPAQVIISPSSIDLNVGQGWGITVRVVDQYGTQIAQPFTWSNSNTAVATINTTASAQGVYIITAVGSGVATITATSGGVSGNILVTVAAVPPRAVSVNISSASTTINVGSTYQFAYTVIDQFGAVMNPAPAAIWGSGNLSVVTVDSNGLATGVSPGRTTITVFSGSVFSSAVLTVNAIPGTFGITAAAGLNGTISPAGYTSVLSGGSQAYTITPNTNYYVADVLVDGVSVGAVTTYSFSNVTANHTISASFAINTNSIAASAGTGGAISPSGTIPAALGSNQTFIIVPNANYHVADVLVDGVSVGAVTTYTFINVANGHTISASFAINTNNIIATAGANGIISPAGVTAVPYGANQIYTITPNAGFQVADVQIDGVSVGAATNYTFINVVAAHTISATFSAIPAITYSVIASAGANGTINPSGTLTLSSGANQSFTITPNVGYHVADVLIDGVSTGAITSYTFTNLSASHTISASFAVNTGTLNIIASVGAGGAITPPGTTAVTSGTNQSYAIAPNFGYQITDVQIDGVSIGPVANYTFTNITTSHTINATFSLIILNASISLAPGWNLITLPVQPVDINANNAPINYTAESFGVLIGADVVTQWSSATQKYLSHIVGLPVGNFAITNGTGFFVHAAVARNIFINGSMVSQSAPLLSSGWNSIGFNGAASITANDFGLTLTGADVVARFDKTSQKWVSHIMNLPVNNFVINSGDAVFIHKP